MKLQSKLLLLIFFFISCNNQNNDDFTEKISGDYIFLTYWDTPNTFKVDECSKFCIDNNCDNCLEIKQIDSLIQTIVGCVGGVDTENERYIDSFDKSCVQEIISNQILYKKNKLDNNILKKISNLYLHEAISVLSIYYYHSYYKLLDTKLSNDK